MTTHEGRAAEISEWAQTGRINTSLMMGAVMRVASGPARNPDYPDVPEHIALAINSSIGRIQAQVDLWIEAVWRNNRLFEYMQSATTTGHEANIGATTVLMFASAGRIMVTFRPGEVLEPNLTIIFAEEREARGGIQGIGATEAEALSLIKVRPRASDFHVNHSVTFG